jgi:predicted  nucleic acid-binding Zn-ribbon protein
MEKKDITTLEDATKYIAQVEAERDEALNKVTAAESESADLKNQIAQFIGSLTGTN